MPPPADAVPRLAPHARLSRDPLTGNIVLLYAEGIVELDETAGEILRQCDGLRPLSAIATALAIGYDADATEILADARDFLDGLAARGLVEFRTPSE